MMSPLTEFLLARVAEDEQGARAATGDHGWRVSLRKRGEVWADRDPSGHDAFLVASTERTRLNAGVTERGMADAAHIARHDPARVLAECEAKREAVALLGVDCEDVSNALRRSWAAEVLRRYAAVYADHPDYNPDWKP